MQFVKQSKWFYKRIRNRKDNLKLGFKNLYIFPSKFGLYWIFTCIYLFILGTNLNNNFSLLITYFLLSIFFINLFLTHFSLHGLIIESIKQDISFANQMYTNYVRKLCKVCMDCVQIMYLLRTKSARKVTTG